jgi:acetoin utilization deacetylase AcuC-like enzyme
VHSEAHVAFIRDLCQAGGGEIDADTYVSEPSYQAALHAAGGACTLVRALSSGQATTGFCALRPAGHHADRDRAMGFCLPDRADRTGVPARAGPRLSRLRRPPRRPTGAVPAARRILGQMTCNVRDFAREVRAPLGAVLEGGYAPAALGQSVVATVAALGGAGEALSAAPDAIVTPHAASHLGHRWTL